LQQVDARPPSASTPVPSTPLIGRESDIDAACELLSAAAQPARLVTLIGPGGVGKTRMALAIADATRDAFTDGVAFIDLAPMREHRLVPATIARALGVRESAGQSARELLIAHLRARQLLLVLDNFEHLLAAAPFVS